MNCKNIHVTMNLTFTYLNLTNEIILVSSYIHYSNLAYLTFQHQGNPLHIILPSVSQFDNSHFIPFVPWKIEKMAKSIDTMNSAQMQL